jgi:hypothetical protein
MCYGITILFFQLKFIKDKIMFPRFTTLNDIRTARAIVLVIKRWKQTLGTHEQFDILESYNNIKAFYAKYEPGLTLSFKHHDHLSNAKHKVFRQLRESDPEFYEGVYYRDARFRTDSRSVEQVRLHELAKLQRSVDELTEANRELLARLA